ncbi:MAG TPA: hypothetical protein VI383_05710, partial [Gemmatimonadales bacterium]|nr:hypothetical protein [Gemmatimonadales bacterium]
MKRPAAAVFLLAAVVALPALGNGFVYDDLPIIVENPAVHDFSGSALIWRTGYWPAGGLYRPLTLQLFALEWAAGAGRPVVFHAVSLILHTLVALLVYRLARLVL